MWLNTDIKDYETEEYLSAVGRALYLCRNFEINFKTTIVWMDIKTAMKASEEPISKEALLNNYSAKFINQMLGHSVRRLKEQFYPTEETLEALNKAKDSRNVIVHDATAAIMNRQHATIKEAGKQLYKHVVNVAEGDNIVSAWHYEILHKKRPMQTMTEDYVEQVVDWIFKPLSPQIHPLTEENLSKNK